MTARPKPRLLMLCHRIPFPPDKGDKIRAWHLLKHLAGRFDIALGCFIDDPDDMIHRQVLQNICVETKFIQIDATAAKLKSLQGLLRKTPLSFSFYENREMREWVAQQRQGGGIACEVAYSSSMAPYLEGASAPTFLDMVDADSAKFSAYVSKGNLAQRLVYWREGRVLAQAEAKITGDVDRVFLVTPEEAGLIRAIPNVDADKIDWYRNGVDTSYWRADASFEKAPNSFDIVFTGAMDYRPNIEAVTGFVENVWPKLRANNPRITFGIVGARPTPQVMSLAGKDGIAVTGRVADMRPYLSAAKIAVAPLQIARGVQNKVLEAMAMATPVVASAAAITGTAATPGEHVVSADTSSEFVMAIEKLLNDPAEALRMGERAAQFIREAYPWETTLKRFDAALDQRLPLQSASSAA